MHFLRKDEEERLDADKAVEDGFKMLQLYHDQVDLFAFALLFSNILFVDVFERRESNVPMSFGLEHQGVALRDDTGVDGTGPLGFGRDSLDA